MPVGWGAKRWVFLHNILPTHSYSVSWTLEPAVHYYSYKLSPQKSMARPLPSLSASSQLPPQTPLLDSCCLVIGLVISTKHTSLPLSSLMQPHFLHTKLALVCFLLLLLWSALGIIIFVVGVQKIFTTTTSILTRLVSWMWRSISCLTQERDSVGAG